LVGAPTVFDFIMVLYTILDVTMEFSTAKMKEMIKSQGDKRVSEESAERLGDILETFAGDVAEEAIAVAKEKDRKTIRAEDIKQALK